MVNLYNDRVKRRLSKKKTKQINRTGKRNCPICNKQTILVEHHLRGRKIPNSEHPSNLSYICSNCHQEIHEGFIIIEGWFMTTKGRELFWHKKEDQGFTEEEAVTYIIPKTPKTPKT